MLSFCFLYRMLPHGSYLFFFFNDTATTEIYTLSLHDALPICMFLFRASMVLRTLAEISSALEPGAWNTPDRKSTRLNSSHLVISYAVFCLKKKNKRDANNAAYIVYSLATLYFTYQRPLTALHS